jgi:hypothetical protein
LQKDLLAHRCAMEQPRSLRVKRAAHRARLGAG